MNIVLIGYRGTGKSAVGEALAASTRRPLVSTDAEIVRRAGCTIPEIVAQFGWEHFRDIEEAVVKDLAGSNGVVIDCGGGVVTRPINIERLRESGKVVWLRAPIEVIAARLEGDDQRPALTGEADFIAEIGTVLAEREPLYEAAADFSVDTAEGSPAAIANFIAQQLEIA